MIGSFDIKSIALLEYVATGAMVNPNFHDNVLRRLREDSLEKDLNLGADAIGCCIMTTRLLTHLSRRNNF